jgi:hypothetical protein
VSLTRRGGRHIVRHKNSLEFEVDSRDPAWGGQNRLRMEVGANANSCCLWRELEGQDSTKSAVLIVRVGMSELSHLAIPSYALGHKGLENLRNRYKHCEPGTFDVLCFRGCELKGKGLCAVRVVLPKQRRRDR